MKRLFLLISGMLMISVSSFIACTKVCDDMLKEHHITIVDQNGNPLTGINLELINTRTNKPLCSQITNDERREKCANDLGESQYFAPGSGVYTIISSFNITIFEHKGDINNGDIVKVHGSVNGAEFSAYYTIHSDECNLDKVIGPETIVVKL